MKQNKTKKDINYYTNLPYKIIVFSDDEGGFLAKYREFEHIALMFGQGRDEAEAIADLKLAFVALVENLLAQNAYIPEPIHKSKSKNLAITMKQNLLDEVDFYANKMGLSRSAFFATSAKHYIASL